MKTILSLFIFFVLYSLMLGCASSHTNKEKISLLLKEITEIAQKSRDDMQSEDIMTKIKRVEENRKNFPASREELKNDSKSVREFFRKSIEEDKQIIQKYEELLKLGLANTEADCINFQLKSTNIGIERKAIVLTQYDLFFDENIRDKKTLDSKTFSIREKLKELDVKNTEIEKQEQIQCAGTKK
jgi:hypothetical protein